MDTYSRTKLTEVIKIKALELGFDKVGISKAEEIEGLAGHISRWLQHDYHAGMHYMAKNIEKRVDPAVLVSGAKSVVSMLVSYYPQKIQSHTVPQIAKYAYGTDYHFVLKDKMKLLWDYIALHVPNIEGSMFVDSAPVSDKLLAVKAGLGWLGKNSCLINKEMGSFVFICELIVNIDLDYDEPYRSNFCGSCTKCIDLCPTKAIVQPGVVDSNKCISYQTIENKNDSIHDEFIGKFENRLFGCDICQDVCPWNNKPLITKTDEFLPGEDFFKLNSESWQKMDKANFNKIFDKSPLKRAGFGGLKRNLDFISRKV